MTPALTSRCPCCGEHSPPVIAELFKLLPAPGGKWPPEKRAVWLSALQASFDVVYGPEQPTGVVILERGERHESIPQRPEPSRPFKKP